MYNKKALLDTLKKLGSAKGPVKKKDIITDPKGQWKHPGKPTRIPSNHITTKDVNTPIKAKADTGEERIMLPEEEHIFSGASYVDEYPVMAKGVSKGNCYPEPPTASEVESKLLSTSGITAKGAKMIEEAGIIRAEWEKRCGKAAKLKEVKPDTSIKRYSDIPSIDFKTSKTPLEKPKVDELLMRSIEPMVDVSYKPSVENVENPFSSTKPLETTSRQQTVLVWNPNTKKHDVKGIRNQEAAFVKDDGEWQDLSQPIVYYNPETNEYSEKPFVFQYEGMNNRYKFQDGGMSNRQVRKATKLKSKLLEDYPAFQNVYGPQGENLNITTDKNFNAKDYGYGDIEFIFPGDGTVNYSDDYQYTSPTPDKYTVVYNKKGAGKGDVYLDMLHGMRDDSEYIKLLDAFSSAVKDARGADMDYFYNKDLEMGFAQDGREKWDQNYIDGILRAQLAGEGMGKRTKNKSDYKLERSYSNPAIQEAASNILNYMKQSSKFQKRGNNKRQQKRADAGKKGRYLKEGPLTPEQADLLDYKYPYSQIDIPMMMIPDPQHMENLYGDNWTLEDLDADSFWQYEVARQNQARERDEERIRRKRNFEEGGENIPKAQTGIIKRGLPAIKSGINAASPFLRGASNYSRLRSFIPSSDALPGSTPSLDIHRPMGSGLNTSSTTSLGTNTPSVNSLYNIAPSIDPNNIPDVLRNLAYNTINENGAVYNIDPEDFQGNIDEGARIMGEEFNKDYSTYGFPEGQVLGDITFKTDFSEGSNARRELLRFTAPAQPKLSTEDFFNDQELVNMANQQADYWRARDQFDLDNPEDPASMIFSKLSGDTSRDELFSLLYPGVGIPNWRSKFMTPNQENELMNYLGDYVPAIRNKGMLSKLSLKSAVNPYGASSYKEIPSEAVKLKEMQNQQGFLYTADPKDVVAEMRGGLGLTLDQIDNASPEQLEKWRQEIIQKMTLQSEERYKKLLGNPFTAGDAYSKMSLNKYGGVPNIKYYLGK